MKNYRVEWRHNFLWRMDEDSRGTYKTMAEAKKAELAMIRAHDHKLETRIVEINVKPHQAKPVAVNTNGFCDVHQEPRAVCDCHRKTEPLNAELMQGELSFDGFGLNASDAYKTRIATFNKFTNVGEYWGPRIVRAVNNYQSMLDALKSVDLSDVKSIARVKVQNAILKAEAR